MKDSTMRMGASVREWQTSGKSTEALLRLAQRIAADIADTAVWLVALDLDEEHLTACAGLLSAEESQRASRFKMAVDRNRFIAGRALLRVLIGRHIDAEPAKLSIGAGPHGKPALEGASSVRFNLAHADASALIAISDEHDVGVDIESLARDVDCDALAKRFFSLREQAEFARVPEGQRKQAFLAAWTRKEAVAKALGQGLWLPLTEIEVTIAPDRTPALMSVPSGDVGRWALYNIDAGRDYIATVALRRFPD